MTKEEQLLYAEKALKFLVERVSNFQEGNKYITYRDLAFYINFPMPYTGSYFGKQIGDVLGVMGHLLDNMEIEDWQGRIPFLQALVVRGDTKLPSTGLKEFYPDYPNLSVEKQKDYIKLEYAKIFEFGERWYLVLDRLGITSSNFAIKDKKKYNPFGSEGSPEHRALRDYIAHNPAVLGLNFDKGSVEYPLKSGDCIDVLFSSENEMVAVEVKSIRSGNDDIERGIYQCIKYHSVLEAENKVLDKNLKVSCILVHETTLSKLNLKQATKLKVNHVEVHLNKQNSR